MSEPIRNTGQSEATTDAATPRRNVGSTDSFKSSEDSSGPLAGGGPASGGKKGKGPKKAGRPPKNLAGFSEAKIEGLEDDPEIEAARLEFEEVLIELLVSTTDNIADARYTVLVKKFPEAEARGLADKARLTDKERKYFGGVAVRLWRKYLGDKYLFTDEAIAGVYALQYGLRNWEPMAQAKKIEDGLNGKNKQSGLQSAANPNPRSIGHREEHTNGSSDPHPPRSAHLGV